MSALVSMTSLTTLRHQFECSKLGAYVERASGFEVDIIASVRRMARGPSHFCDLGLSEYLKANMFKASIK